MGRMTTTSSQQADLRRAPARVVLAAGLLLAAAGVFTQFLTGVPGFPPIPPGPIILAVAALVVAVVRWRWAPAGGPAVAVFITVGFLTVGFLASVSGSRLANPSALGSFLGTWSMAIGLVIALVSAVVSLVIAARARRIRT